MNNLERIPKKRSRNVRKSYFLVKHSQKYRNRKELYHEVEILNSKSKKFKYCLKEATFVKQSSQSTKPKVIYKDKTAQEIKLEQLVDLEKNIMAKELANISDNKYHMFRKHLNLQDRIAPLCQIKSYKNELNQKFTKITTKKGIYFKSDERFRYILEHLHKTKKIKEDDDIVVKLTCDGVNLTKSHVKLLNFSFTIINETDRCKTSNGNYILGVYDIEDENYDEVQECLNELLADLKNINQIDLNGNLIKIKYKFAADLKMLALLFGVNSANSNYPCPWCKWNKNKPLEISDSWLIKSDLTGRNIKEAKEKFSNKTITEREGYIKPPILDFIEPIDCVLELLHCLLRITDKFEDYLVKFLIEIDGNATQDLSKRPFFNEFMKFLKKIKITNAFYKSENTYKLKSLSGSEKFDLFSKLDLEDLYKNMNLNNDNKERLIKINKVFKQFMKLLEEIKTFSDQTKLDNLQTNLRNWLSDYTYLFPLAITPYIHAFVYHSCEFIKQHGNINLYNTQGLEKLNHLIIQSYHFATNKNKRNNAYLKQIIERRVRIEKYMNSLEKDISDHESDIDAN